MSKEKLIKEIKSRRLPLREAFKISIKNIQIRFSRSILTASGIFLGIAFLVSVLTSSLIISKYYQRDETLTARQIWLVAISLLVCGVGITNSMLMSVFERYKEIGTMKCLGALDKFIIELFLIESTLIGFFSSFLGGIFGFFITVIFYSYRFKENLFLRIQIGRISEYILISLIIGILLSLIFSIYPAYRAAKLPPASALKAEI
jgi:ABC-type antimicrobial peptide transport system permease subunit